MFVSPSTAVNNKQTKMSFQDMGKKGSRGGAAATQQSYSARPASSPTSGNSPLAQLSENLNQYQVSSKHISVFS